MSSIPIEARDRLQASAGTPDSIFTRTAHLLPVNVGRRRGGQAAELAIFQPYHRDPGRVARSWPREGSSGGSTLHSALQGVDLSWLRVLYAAPRFAAMCRALQRSLQRLATTSSRQRRDDVTGSCTPIGAAPYFDLEFRQDLLADEAAGDGRRLASALSCFSPCFQPELLVSCRRVSTGQTSLLEGADSKGDLDTRPAAFLLLPTCGLFRIATSARAVERGFDRGEEKRNSVLIRSATTGLPVFPAPRYPYPQRSYAASRRRKPTTSSSRRRSQHRLRDSFGTGDTIVRARPLTIYAAPRALHRLPDSGSPCSTRRSVQSLPEGLACTCWGRYCESDVLSETALNLFGNTPPSGTLAAICDFVQPTVRLSCARPPRRRTRPSSRRRACAATTRTSASRSVAR